MSDNLVFWCSLWSSFNRVIGVNANIFFFIFQFNDALLYATTLQPGQYKLNNELSLSGMKVNNNIWLEHLHMVFYSGRYPLIGCIFDFFRLVSQVMKDIRMSWTSKVLNALLFCLPGESLT